MFSGASIFLKSLLVVQQKDKLLICLKTYTISYDYAILYRKLIVALELRNKGCRNISEK